MPRQDFGFRLLLLALLMPLLLRPGRPDQVAAGTPPAGEGVVVRPAQGTASLATRRLSATLRHPAASPDRAAEGPATVLAGRWSLLAGGDEVLALGAGDDGRLWAGTEGGGLLRWNADGSFVQDLPGAGLPPIGSRIFAVERAPDGSVWLAGSLGIARRFDERWTHYGAAEGLPPGPYVALAFAPEGRVWAASAHEGLATLPPGEGRWLRLDAVPYAPEAADQPQGPGSQRIADLAYDGGGRLWVAHGTGDSGRRPALSMWDSGRDRWKHLAPVAPGAATMAPASDQIVALDVDPLSGDLWAASWGRGLLHRRALSGLWSAQEPPDCGRYLRQVALIDDAVWVACGNALRGAGIARLQGDAWERWLASEGQDLLSQVSAFGAHGEALWLGLNGKPGASGYLLLDRGAPDPSGAIPLSSGPRLPPANAVTALLEDGDGALWVGTRGAGLLRRGPEGLWTRYTQAGTGGLLPGDTVTDLALRAGQLWVATTKTHYQGRSYTDGGLGHLDLLSGNWRPALRAGSGGLPDGELSSLALDDAGRLWMGIGAAIGGPAAGDVAFAGDGVAVLDTRDGRLTTYDQGPGQAGLVGSTVLDLAWLPGGQLWLATAYDSYSSSGRSVGGGVSRRMDERWTGWKVGQAGLAGWAGQGHGGGSFDLVSGDFRSIHVDAASGEVLAGTWTVDPDRPDDAIARWPRVDGVVNRWDGSSWQPTVLPGAGWVTAFARTGAHAWAGSSRGAAMQDLGATHGLVPQDDVHGLWLRSEGSWEPLDLAPLGLDLPAVSALTLGADGRSLWIGTESGGVLRYQPALVPPEPSTEPATPLPTATEVPPTEQAPDTPAAPPATETALPPTPSPSPSPPSPEPTDASTPTPAPGPLATATAVATAAEPTPTPLDLPPSPQPPGASPTAVPEPAGTEPSLNPWRAGYRCFLPRLEQRKRRR